MINAVLICHAAIQKWYSKYPYHSHVWHSFFPSSPIVGPLSEGPVQIPIFVQALHLVSWPHTQSLYLDPSSRSPKIGGYFQSKHQLQVSLSSSFLTFEDFQHLVQPRIFKLRCLKCFIQQLVFFNEIIYSKTWSAVCLGIFHLFFNPLKS